MFAYIALCRDNLVDKTECFGISRNIGVESGIRKLAWKPNSRLYQDNIYMMWCNKIKIKIKHQVFIPNEMHNCANCKHYTDSDELWPTNLFANGSAVDHYPGWLVSVTIMVMVVIRVAIRVFKMSASYYNSNPSNWKPRRAHWRWKIYRVRMTFQLIC